MRITAQDAAIILIFLVVGGVILLAGSMQGYLGSRSDSIQTECNMGICVTRYIDRETGVACYWRSDQESVCVKLSLDK